MKWCEMTWSLTAPDPRRGCLEWKRTGVCIGQAHRASSHLLYHLWSLHDRSAYRQKGYCAGTLMNATLSCPLKEKGRHYLFYSGSPLFDRQVKVFSFGKCLSWRFQEINLATPFLTTLWRNLANLAQAITAVPLVINSEAQLICGPKSHSCSKRCS